MMETAIILAGGYGSRLANVLKSTCKPMAPIGEKPFLQILLDQLVHFGFSDVVIADGYRREKIESYFKNNYKGISITYSSEVDPLLTGGAVKKASELCDSEWVYVFNGDTYCDFDLKVFSCFKNQTNDFDAVILGVKKNNFDRYGSLDFDDQFHIKKFNEKVYCREGYINAGVYLIKRSQILNYPKEKFSIENEWFLQKLKEDRLRIAITYGYFIDIGIPEDYTLAIKHFCNKEKKDGR